jgi:hypothetical protein
MITIINDFDAKNEMLEEEIATLQTALDQAVNQPKTGVSVGLGMTPIDLVVNTTIKDIYLRYIQTYGVPEDGIFIPSLLNELMNATSSNIVINQSVAAPGVLSGTVSPTSTFMSSPTASPTNTASPVPDEPVLLVDSSGSTLG